MTILDGMLPSGRSARIGIADGRIATVEQMHGGTRRIILPGFVDLQVNGYAGIDLNAADLTTDAVKELTRTLWSQGVTAYCPTVISAPEQQILTTLRTIARARSDDQLTAHAVCGIHVEGPYISPIDGARGAHEASFLREPDPDELRRWQDAAAGALRIVTLAPEIGDSARLIAAASAIGVISAIGHTAAGAGQIHAAVAAGASLSTHLGNGIQPMLPRHPNALWSQLAEHRLSASFIADGHHLPADTFTAMVRAKGIDRAIMVSDSAALAGCPPGEYSTPVGGSVTVEPDGRLRLTGSQLLAGAGHSLADCVNWVSSATEFSLSDIARMTSHNPARLIGHRAHTDIAAGAAADLVVLEYDESGRLRPVVTYLGGELVYQA